MKEYKIIYDRDDVDTQSKLNELASDGWRLHSAISGFGVFDDDQTRFYAQFIMERDK